MRQNEFTHIPIKRQTAENKNPNELDIEFLSYPERKQQARPTGPTQRRSAQARSGERRPASSSAAKGRMGRATTARPEPRLQHPAKTPQRVARPAQQADRERIRRSQEPDIEFFDYDDKEKLTRLAKEERARQARPAQARPTQQRQQRPSQVRPAQERQAQARGQRQAQARPTQQRQQRPSQARPTQQRQQRPSQQRPSQARPAQQRQQRPSQARPAQQRQQAKQRTKAPKEKSSFRKGLTIAWIAFCVILAAALVLLTVFLSNYEKSRPSDMIHQIVSAVEKGALDDLHLKTEDGTSLEDGQILADPQAIASYILQKEEESEDGITFRVINGESDDNKKVYLIKAGDQKVLKTVIERSEKKYAFGFTGWQEKETVLLSDAFPVSKLKVQIPQSDQLLVNGKTIGREYLVSEGDRISLLGRLITEGYIGEQPTMDTYEIPGIFLKKEISATDTSGRTYDCILTADTYTGGFDAPQAFIDEQYDRVIDMFEPYAFYFSGEAGSGALARIMLDDSPAYNSAISADVSWMQEHSDVEITEKKAENFKQYSDEAFSCDISFLQTIYQGEEAVKTWDTNMTWIFVRDGDNYYIADFVTKTADEG